MQLITITLGKADVIGEDAGFNFRIATCQDEDGLYQFSVTGPNSFSAQRLASSPAEALRSVCQIIEEQRRARAHRAKLHAVAAPEPPHQDDAMTPLNEAQIVALRWVRDYASEALTGFLDAFGTNGTTLWRALHERRLVEVKRETSRIHVTAAGIEALNALEIAGT